MRILSILGTRPEAIKMAPIIKALANAPGFDSQVCITAQHREMLDQVLSLFDITPDFDLNLMRSSQSLSDLTARIFTHLDPVLEQWQPDWVLIQGDTTTVMAAALTAFYRHIKIGHVEAGLRTGNKLQPFPEEVNRRVTSVIADLHFAPTEHSRQNLLREDIPDWRIAVTGNSIIDALHVILKRPPPIETTQLLNNLQIGKQGKKLILVTAHRRENFGQPLENICFALKSIAARFKNQVQLVYPVHLNPMVQEPVNRILSKVENITLLPPLEYLPLVHLMQQATLILTDSGGIQEEATAMSIPTLVLREATERPEGVEAGMLTLVGSDTNRIIEETANLLESLTSFPSTKIGSNPYGDGHAAERILTALGGYELLEARHYSPSLT
jgi:UDP-N-acetylglucosamine 2-epimerase (non-hydrolysing)